MIEELKRSMKTLYYPGNQFFDIETLEPTNDETKKRVELAKFNMPELVNGGDSLLDIGSNKGFISLYYADRYKKIVGVEMMRPYWEFSEKVRKLHKKDNVMFLNEDFRHIFIDKFQAVSTDSDKKEFAILAEMPEKYDVVYVGGVHHHFYKDAIESKAERYVHIKKLAGLARKYLILDGPFDVNYHTVRNFAKIGNWTEQEKSEFNLGYYKTHLSPQFELIRFSPNEKGRHTAVFKRVKEDMEGMNIEDVPKENRDILSANKLRGSDKVFKVGNVRYKFDDGGQISGIYLILNSLSKWFPRTTRVIKEGERIIGDEVEFIKGECFTDSNELLSYWLRLNNDLSQAGIIELHYKLIDFLKAGDKVYDIDSDMVRHIKAVTKEYKNKWLTARKKECSEKTYKILEFVMNNLDDKLVFKKAIDMDEEK